MKVWRTTRNVIVGAALLTCALPVSARADMEPQRIAKLRSLDKITARTMTFEAEVGSTVKFGPLFIKIRACHKAPPIEQPEAAAFLQIWENSLKDKTPQWVFSGWMFASSPALSPMDHAVYDVWVLDCMAYKTGEEPPPEKPAVAAPVPAQEPGAPAAEGTAAPAEAAAPPASPSADPAATVPPATEEPIPEEDMIVEEAPPSPDAPSSGPAEAHPDDAPADIMERGATP